MSNTTSLNPEPKEKKKGREGGRGGGGEGRKRSKMDGIGGGGRDGKKCAAEKFFFRGEQSGSRVPARNEELQKLNQLKHSFTLSLTLRQ